MPSYYSPTYYEDQKKEYDFYINLGNQCRKAEEHHLLSCHFLLNNYMENLYFQNLAEPTL